jgi:hypothetical protein
MTHEDDARVHRQAIADSTRDDLGDNKRHIGPEFHSDEAQWVAGEITLREFAERTLRRHGVLP